jgi:HK97 family phage major capsid protein
MSMLKRALEARDAKQVELDALLKSVEDSDEKRTAFTADETEKFNAINAELKELDERIGELAEAEKRSDAAAEVRKAAGNRVAVGDGVTSEPNPVYRRDSHNVSFFRDLAGAASTSGLLSHGLPSADEARSRLAASQERRAGANITPDATTAATNGGEFAPPLWLVKEFVSLARPARPTADLMNRQALPGGVASINLPRLTTGTAVGVQATQGNNITEQAVVTDSVSSGIATLAGKSILPLQLLEQSGVAFDEVVLGDLARAYAVQANLRVLYATTGTGSGLSSVAATDVAYTSASPKVASATNADSLYYQVTQAVAKIQAATFMTPDALVMHPRRWAWVLGSVDAQSRPLVVPAGPGVNQVGSGSQDAPQGFAGTFAGFPVYIDPSVVSNLGASTNQDEVYVLKRGEHWLWESPVQAASFDATYADNLSVLYRVHGYMAQIFNRRAKSAEVIRGTGLVAP